MPSRNRRFIGRGRQVEELEYRLLGGTDCRELAISGLGGVGKSQIVLEFCYHTKENYPEYSIFWTSAISRPQFEKDYGELAEVCNIPVTKRKDLLSIVKKFLSSAKAGPWILVVDNADDRKIMFDGIDEYLPTSEYGITIFTTRNVDFARELTDGNVLDVEEMEYSEAKGLLDKSLGHKVSSRGEEVTELLEELTFLPLAIIQASSFILKTHITVSGYLTLMRSADEEKIKLLNEEYHDRTRPAGLGNAVARTWLISFENIQEQEPSVVELLYFLAFIENTDIPYSILPMESGVDCAKAVGILMNYSFLIKQEKTDKYNMHRLVHQSVRAWFREFEDMSNLGTRPVSHLASIFPADDSKNQYLWQQYIPHAIRAIKLTAHDPTEDRATLSLLVGRCLGREGRVLEALELLTDCVLWRSENLDSHSASLIESQRDLATAYRWDGQAEEAVDLLEQVMHKQENLSTMNREETLKTWYELGLAYLWCNRPKDAVNYLQKVVHEWKDVSVDRDNLLAAQHSLALAYRSNGQGEEAFRLLEQDSQIDPKVTSMSGKIRSLSSPLSKESNSVSRRVELKSRKVEMATTIYLFEARIGSVSVKKQSDHDNGTTSNLHMLSDVLALMGCCTAERNNLLSNTALSIFEQERRFRWQEFFKKNENLDLKYAIECLNTAGELCAAQKTHSGSESAAVFALLRKVESLMYALIRRDNSVPWTESVRVGAEEDQQVTKATESLSQIIGKIAVVLRNNLPFDSVELPILMVKLRRIGLSNFEFENTSSLSLVLSYMQTVRVFLWSMLRAVSVPRDDTESNYKLEGGVNLPDLLIETRKNILIGICAVYDPWQDNPQTNDFRRTVVDRCISLTDDEHELAVAYWNGGDKNSAILLMSDVVNTRKGLDEQSYHRRVSEDILAQMKQDAHAKFISRPGRRLLSLIRLTPRAEERFPEVPGEKDRNTGLLPSYYSSWNQRVTVDEESRSESDDFNLYPCPGPTNSVELQ